MKNLKFLLVPFAIIGFLVGNLNPVEATAAIGLAVAAPLLKTRINTGTPHVAALTKEIWVQFIMGAIFKANAFLTFSFNADEHVLAGKVVHIPQAGAPSPVTKNRSSLPASVSKRSDTEVTYPLDEFTTDPRVVVNAETVELSYDKMESVTKDDMSGLRQTIAENIIIAWCPSSASQIIRTTGADTAAHMPSATGTRKGFITGDLKRAMKVFNKQDIPQEGRYAMVDADMYDQIIDSLTEKQEKDFSRAYDEKNGILGKLHTFNIIMRSTVAAYDNATTPAVKAYGASGATTDNAVCLCWHEDAVERAIGEIKAFDETDSPIYYGDIVSFLARAGGRIRRADEKGVLAIVQAAGA